MTDWVLLRGLTRESAHWGRFVDAMAQAWPASRVVALDLPGAGSRHAVSAPRRVADMASDCRDRLLRAGVTAPYGLLGLSLGGMVAAQWAAGWPAEVTRCVLVNTSMRPHGALRHRLRPQAWARVLRLLLEPDAHARERAVLALTTAFPERHGAVVDDWVAIGERRPVTRANALAQLVAAARFRAPARPLPADRMLVLCSRADRLVDPRCSHRLAEAWGCPLAEHPAGGHDLPLDDPGWVVAAVARAFAADGPRE